MLIAKYVLQDISSGHYYRNLKDAGPYGNRWTNDLHMASLFNEIRHIKLAISRGKLKKDRLQVREVLLQMTEKKHAL